MAITDPRGIPGLLVWYDARLEAGLADGAALTQLTDQSGNSYHAAISGAPTWAAADGPDAGARYVFDAGNALLPTAVLTALQSTNLPKQDWGTDNRIAGAEAMATIRSRGTGPHWSFSGEYGNTFFDPTDPANPAIRDMWGIPSSYDTHKIGMGPDAQAHAWHTYGVSAVGLFSGTNTTSYDGDMVAWVDGHPYRATSGQGTGGPFPYFSPYNIYIGGYSNTFFNGDFGCFVLYNRRLTFAERDDLYAWMGLPVGTLTVPGDDRNDPIIITPDETGAYDSGALSSNGTSLERELLNQAVVTYPGWTTGDTAWIADGRTMWWRFTADQDTRLTVDISAASTGNPQMRIFEPGSWLPITPDGIRTYDDPVVMPVRSGESIEFMMWTPSSTEVDDLMGVTATAEAAVLPPNDDWTSATEIVLFVGGYTSDPITAALCTTASDEPQIGDDNNTDGTFVSAWWKFTPTADTSLQVDTYLSNPQGDAYVLLATYRDDGGTLTLLTFQDEPYYGPNGDGSSALFAATAGQTYYIQVAMPGWMAPYTDVEYVLRATEVVIPPNDDRANAAEVVFDVDNKYISEQVDAQFLTAEAGEKTPTDYGTRTAWWKLTPAYDMTVDIDTMLTISSDGTSGPGAYTDTELVVFTEGVLAPVDDVIDGTWRTLDLSKATVYYPGWGTVGVVYDGTQMIPDQYGGRFTFGDFVMRYGETYEFELTFAPGGHANYTVDLASGKDADPLVYSQMSTLGRASGTSAGGAYSIIIGPDQWNYYDAIDDGEYYVQVNFYNYCGNLTGARWREVAGATAPTVDPALLRVADDSDSGEDAGGGDYSALISDLDITGGTTYYIQVGNYDDSDDPYPAKYVLRTVNKTPRIDYNVILGGEGTFFATQNAQRTLSFGGSGTLVVKNWQSRAVTFGGAGQLRVQRRVKRTAVFGGSGGVEFDAGLPIIPPELGLEVLDPIVHRAPTPITVVVSEADPDTEVVFFIDGTQVYSATADSDGYLGPLSINVPEELGAAGDHQVSAAQMGAIGATVTFTVQRDPTLAPSALGPDAQAVEVPEAMVNGVRKWVLQDLLPGGLGSWVMPTSPEQMGSPYFERTLTAKTTTAGRHHVSEGAQVPVEWTFSGFAPSMEVHDQLLAYGELKRRFYVIDHRNRAFKVAPVGVELVPQLRKNYNGVEVDGHQYTMTVLILDQDWVNPA